MPLKLQAEVAAGRLLRVSLLLGGSLAGQTLESCGSRSKSAPETSYQARSRAPCVFLGGPVTVTNETKKDKT